MWFKTRIGLVHLEGNADLIAVRHDDEKDWVGIVVYHGFCGGSKSKSLFRRNEQLPTYTYLARMRNAPDVDRIVAECMQRIENAIRSGERICDLSDVGCEEAWLAPAWIIPPWQRRQ